MFKIHKSQADLIKLKGSGLSILFKYFVISTLTATYCKRIIICVY